MVSDKVLKFRQRRDFGTGFDDETALGLADTLCAVVNTKS